MDEVGGRDEWEEGGFEGMKELQKYETPKSPMKLESRVVSVAPSDLLLKEKVQRRSHVVAPSFTLRQKMGDARNTIFANIAKKSEISAPLSDKASTKVIWKSEPHPGLRIFPPSNIMSSTALFQPVTALARTY